MYLCISKQTLHTTLCTVAGILAVGSILIYGRSLRTDSVASAPAVAAASYEWGLSFQTEREPPVPNLPAEDLRPYDAFYCGDSAQKRLYLTFDAGYENGNTAPILDALKKHNAPGAFFVVSHFVKENPDLVKRMAAEGHIVGNHTYHHPDMSQKNETEFKKELNDLAALYEETVGKPLDHFYRPPEGKFSDSNLKWAKSLGYQTIFWSLAYVDWDPDAQPSHETAFSKLLSRTHNGAIVLLHSTSATNAEILDELLTKWEEMGYSFGSLTELSAIPVLPEE